MWECSSGLRVIGEGKNPEKYYGEGWGPDVEVGGVGSCVDNPNLVSKMLRRVVLSSNRRRGQRCKSKEIPEHGHIGKNISHDANRNE